MNEIKEKECKALIEVLTKQDLFNTESAEAIVHALADIKQSINHIYCKILPNIIYNNKSMTREQILNELWEIREQFRHIDYHIKDSNITDI